MKPIKLFAIASALVAVCVSFATAKPQSRPTDGPQGLGPWGNVSASQLTPGGR